MGISEALPHAVAIELWFDFDDQFADMEGFYACHGRLVGAQNSTAEELSESASHLHGSRLDKRFLIVLHVNGNQPVERRIVKVAAFVCEVVEESLVIVANHLRDDGQVGVGRLQENQSLPALSTSPTAHLSHHHESIFVGAEVGKVQHRVGIEDAHDAHTVEVEAFANHLRPDEHVGASRREVGDEAFIGIFGARRVEVHAGYACFGKDFDHLVFNLLSAIPPSAQIGSAAIGAFRGRGIGETAVMTGELVERFVQGERYIRFVS